MLGLVLSQRPTRCAKVFWDNGAHETRLDRKVPLPRRCTRRIPAPHNTVLMRVLAQVQGHRMAPPLSKLHKGGKALLEAAGWRKTARTSPLVPAFSWCVRQGGDLGVFHGTLPPPVRQLPQEVTDLLDDKCNLHLTLQAAGVAHLAPETFVDMHVSLPAEGEQDSDQSDFCDLSGAAGVGPGRGPARVLNDDALVPSPPTRDVWFLKHRRGVKGQAVTPFFSSLVSSHRDFTRLRASLEKMPRALNIYAYICIFVCVCEREREYVCV